MYVLVLRELTEDVLMGVQTRDVKMRIKKVSELKQRHKINKVINRLLWGSWEHRDFHGPENQGWLQKGSKLWVQIMCGPSGPSF